MVAVQNQEKKAKNFNEVVNLKKHDVDQISNFYMQGEIHRGTQIIQIHIMIIYNCPTISRKL